MKAPLLWPPRLPGQRPPSCLDRQHFKAEPRGERAHVCVHARVCASVSVSKSDMFVQQNSEGKVERPV